jgi:F-type H+-transporting ATPase subunit gamma
MPNPREIRRRIKSIGNTAQITRAMQMVASSKMRKAQQAALTMRPFAQLLYRIQRRALTRMHDFSHPLIEAREVRRRGVIVVGADKGLCGPLNSNLFRIATQFDPATTVFIAVGKRPGQFLARARRQLVAEFTYSDSPRFAEARPIVAFACNLFLKGEVDEVLVVATRFVNTLTQQSGTINLLPIGEIKGLKVPGAESEEELHADTTEFVFERDPDAVPGYLLNQYLNIFMYRVLLDARASEQSARMVAMKNATDSARDLIDELTLAYNKLRQGNITNELLTIAGGQQGND